MSNDVQRESSDTKDRLSRLTPAQREMLQKRLRGEGTPTQPKNVIKRRPGLDYPVTAEQEHLWLLHQVDPDVYYFNHSHAYLLKGDLNLSALQAAVNELVRRHENLRSSFPEINGKPRVVVTPKLEIPLDSIEVPEFPVEDRHDRLQALITANTCRPFDILNGPLVRATLYRVTQREHAIVLTLHHIVTDFVSHDLVDRELFTLYDAFSRGLPSPLPELPVQYGDFAFWLDQWMKSDEAARQAEYWTRKLADLPRLDLVTDMPRPHFRSFRGERLTWPIPEALWLQFKQMTLSENITRFTAFLAIFAMLLREYSGKDDVPIATPVSIRKHRETQALIGYFLNTVVFRLDLSGDPTFLELLQRTRMLTLEAVAHSDLPFEFLMNKLSVERDPSRAPLVDASYAFGNDLKGPPTATGGLLVEAFDPFYRSAFLDINLGVNDNSDSAIAVLDYVPDLFLRSTGERMMLHFQRLFTQAATDPNRRLSNFVLLSNSERQQIVVDWNNTVAPYPSAQTIADCFAAQVDRAGDDVALRSPQTKLTYRELNERANQLAHRLIRSGVKAETRVAILMERSVDTIVATLAVLKAGGAYLPLHPAYPPDRMRMIMEEAGVSVLLLDRITAERGLTAEEVIVVDDDPFLAAEDATDPGVIIEPDQLAYVIYTSGSTGTPKGVAVTHRNVLSLAFDHGWREGSLERVLFHSSHAFDASTFEMWAPLLRGKEVIIAPPGDLDIALYTRLLKEQKVTAIFITSGLFNVLAQEAPACFAGVREVWAGGDVVPAAAVQRVREHCPDTLVSNVYGPTETTTFATHYAVSTPEKVTGNIPIGSPMDNHEAYILDSGLKPVPVRVPGELFIAGAGLARGYLNRPDFTAERFVPNPFGDSGTRMYNTGDRARWREDGQIEFLGRTDLQVKLRGYRIELAEIEAALLHCRGVGQAAVVVHEDHMGEKRLVGYVVPASGQTVDTAELRRSLAEQLPDYMVPAFIIVLSLLPLNSNGKLDRRALPEPEADGTGAGRPPSTRAEQILCSLLAQVLGIPQPSPEDNFFSLGGDSILAIQLVSRARQAGLILNLRDVFEQPTIEAMASASHSTRETTSTAPDVGVGPMPPMPIMCWFLEQGGSLFRFSQSMLLQVPAGLDQEDLTCALQAVLDRHDALRLRFTGFKSIREEWKLEVQPPDALSAATCLRRIDIAGVADDVLQQQIKEETDAAETRLSADEGRMLQAVWFDAGPERSGRLLLTIHHLSVDGVSWRILLPDLATAWAGIAAGASPALEPCPMSFRGWAERLSREALNPARTKELAFWTQILKGAQDLVPDRTLNSSRAKLGALEQMTLTLPPAITNPLLNQVAAAFRARINDVLLTGFVLSVLKWRRQKNEPGTSVLIDLEGHGREGIFEGVDLSRTVGLFTSMFPVRLDPGEIDVEEAWAGGKALGRALRTIKEQLSALPDNGIGYGLLRYLNPETSAALSGLPKSQIDFNYLGRFPAAATADWTSSEALAGGMDPDMPFHHPLEVDSVVLERATGPELVATWTWMPDMLSTSDIHSLAEGWFHVLEALVLHSAKPGVVGLTPSDLPLIALSQSEIDQLAIEYGDIQDMLPLSPVQAGMLFHAFYDASGPDVYNVQILLSLEGVIGETSLRAAAQALLQRHDNLRAAFKHEGLAQPVQIIPSDVELPWETVDFSALETPEMERKLADLVKEDRLARFDPGISPLFRFVLVRCATEKFRLVITTHHILIDGWSVPLLVDELFQLYADQGRSTALPRVTPFREYLVWLAGRDRSAAESAWREALAGVEEGTRLSSAALGEPQIPERLTVKLEAELIRRLTEQARSHSLTLNNVMQGIWAILLSRLTRRDDVVFGSTVSGRSPEIAGIETIIGLLINTLPTRVQLRPTDSFDSLLSRLNQQQSRLLAHQHLGLVDIQRLTGVNELFDTLVIFENFPMNTQAEQKRVGGLRLADLEANDAAHYPLTVLVVAPPQQLWLCFDYLRDHFKASFIDSLSRHFVRLLAAYAETSNQPVSSIDLLEAQERRQILLEWNHTNTAYPRNNTMMELFAEQVQRRGEEVAVVCGKAQISYAELDRRSNQLARYLRAFDVGLETLVGISVERSIDMVVAMVGILKAGGAYVPIDPGYPPDRLRFMVEDSGIGVLLTQKRLAPGMPQVNVPIVCLDYDWDEIAQQDDRFLQNHAAPENLAYVIYTSGSTGQPKATAISHRSLIRLLRNTNYIQLQGHEVVAQTTNLSFDPTTFEIWGALLNGCRLAVIGNEVLLDVDRFTMEIKEQGVQVMFLATALFNEMVRQNPSMFNSVKSLLVGGEAAHPGNAASVLGHGGPERLVNMYGPAECTTFSTWYLINELAKDAVSVPIGKPVANTRVYVLDHTMNLVPAGVVGQLYIGGEGLSRGYWKRPELTAEKFVPNPFGEPGDRVYSSGDLARWREDGTLEFLGRADNQVKIRSFRVELGEIEAALREQGSVRDCAVLMKTDAGGKRLVAYVSGEVKPEELRNYLKDKLPDYMVPSVWLVLPELPLNTNGKVDRRALLEVQENQPEAITAVEELLADIWAEVLGVTHVGVRANFFDLGGHSLLALRVVSRVNDYFQTELSVRTLLERPLLLEFAQEVRSVSRRPVHEVEKIAMIGLKVRRMTPEQRKAALEVQ